MWLVSNFKSAWSVQSPKIVKIVIEELIQLELAIQKLCKDNNLVLRACYVIYLVHTKSNWKFLLQII